MKRIRDREKQRSYERAWYARNRAKAIAKAKAKKQLILAWYREYKRTLSCIRCGENDPVTLDFHHRDPSKKDFLPSRACFNGWGINRLKEEIAKCDVLCANGHRKLHRDLKEQKKREALATAEFASGEGDGAPASSPTQANPEVVTAWSMTALTPVG
jgi:hypothetical protein